MSALLGAMQGAAAQGVLWGIMVLGVYITYKLLDIADPVSYTHLDVYKRQELDIVIGLDGGADDYMTKPFGVLELSARIRTLLRRRSKAPVTEDVISQDIISVDRKTREVTVDGAKVELTLKEFELLTYLLENKARVVTREELLNHIWGYDYDGETRTLDMHIRTLRQKLGAEAGAMVKTIRGVGYRLLKRGEV